MQERSLLQLFVGNWNTKTIVAVAVGAALFGVLMVFASWPIFVNTMLTAAMIVPVVVGGLFGPLAAFATMALGNIVADLVGGWGMWFNWSIGNGVLGLFIGALPLYGARIDEGIFKIKHAIIYVILVVIGNIIAFGVVTPIFTTLFYGDTFELSLMQGVFAMTGNSIILCVVGIPILFAMTRRYKSRSNLRHE